MKAPFCLAVLLVAALTACSARSAGRVVTRTVAATGKIATKTTLTAVKAGGTVATTAAKASELDTYMKGFQILRDGIVIASDWKKMKTARGNPELRPGDVVELRRLNPARKSG